MQSGIANFANKQLNQLNEVKMEYDGFHNQQNMSGIPVVSFLCQEGIQWTTVQLVLPKTSRRSTYASRSPLHLPL